jgi:hypothetical protein
MRSEPTSPGTTAHYRLAVPEGARRTLATGWLMLALGSLVLSGIFSVLLVLSRAPYVKDFFPWVDFFHVALVVHVDLSVLVWFLAFAGVFWSVNSTQRWISLGWIALFLAVAGTLMMSAAPFAAPTEPPIMSNYVPVLDGRVFLAGLTVFAAGCALLVFRSMAAVPLVGIRIDGAGALRFGLNAALVSTAVALLAFLWSYLDIPRSLDAKAYYELLFWGGGHVLQFTYALLMFVAWLWLLDGMGARVPLSPRVAVLLFGIGLVAVFLTPMIYLSHDASSVPHHRWMTWMMQFGGGLAILPFSLAVLLGVVRSRSATDNAQPLRAALIASLVLFGAGGIIGLMIHGSNVKIPAHYHGSIVGITLAFMGLTYHLLPQMGFARPALRAATWQAWIYGSGQMLHIIGLVWSGGYGVQRKVAGAAQALRTSEEIMAMGLMGLGGLVAVVGGLMFLVIVVKAMSRQPRTPSPEAVSAWQT